MRISNTGTTTGTLSSSGATHCGFDPNGAPHLMGILSNIYRDPSLAVLREYSANALDAHLRAGVSDPIQVTLPSDIEPTLTISDRGTGLSEQEILAVYANYGTSTKRDSNDEVGAFGIGAKSAFAISTQFSVIGIKNGERTSALFALNEAGVATVSIVARESTDEPNGVTVAVPVTDPAAMRRAAKRLFGFWKPGTVVVDGKAPKYLPASALRVTDTLYARFAAPQNDSATETPAVTIVMGGIPYPASVPMLETVARHANDQEVRRLVTRLTQRWSTLRLMAFAEVGSVDITPSREDLRDTPRTLKMLAQVFAEYLGGVEAAVRRAVSAESSPLRAAIRLSKLMLFVPDSLNSLLWREHQFAGHVTLPFPSITLSTSGKSTRASLDETPTIGLHFEWDGVRVVTGVDASNLNRVRRVANRYMTHHRLTTLLLAPTERATVGWYSHGEDDSPLDTVTVADFLASASTLPASSTRTETTYMVLRGDQVETLPVREIKAAAQEGRVLVTDKSDLTGWFREALADDEMLVVLTGMQTESALRRRVPGLVDAATLVRTHAQRMLDGASEQELLALGHRPVSWIERVTSMSLDTIAPVRALIKRYQAEKRAYETVSDERRNALRRAASEAGSRVPFTQHTTGFPVLDLVLRGLADSGVHTVTDAVRDDLALYLRAAGAAEQSQAA